MERKATIINQTGSASRIGTYQRTGESNNVIGDINADWKAGLNKQHHTKTKFKFLLDMQKEEMFFSLDVVWLRYRNV
jgi:hypothetical protein